MFSGGIYLFGCVVYWFWAEGEVQPWAIQDLEPEDNKTTNSSQPEGILNLALVTKDL